MLAGVWVEVVALVAAFAIAVVTTPARVSGAVLLLPFQVSVLGTPSPAVTPTNLVYNVVASPGAIWRYRRQGQTGGALTWLLLAGTLPGVIAGSVIRVYVLPGPVVFDFVVAAVLIPLGAWLALTQAVPAHTTRQARLPRVVIGLIAAVAGCVGGIYGIGGGSILAPILVADGQPPSQVAPAALSSTFLTSLAGVDMTDLLRRIARFFRDEPCGQCVPCRLGTVRQEELLGRLLRGTPIGSAERELALLDDIAMVARDASICGLGQTAVGAAQSAVRLGLIGGNGTGGNGKEPA